MQVYDHGVRVPALLRGPGVTPGTNVALPTSMVDVAPTLLELAAGADAVPSSMDGRSLAPLVVAPGDTTAPGTKQTAAEHRAAVVASWRDAVLIEYQSIAQAGLGPGRMRHPVDGVNNTFRALRILNTTHNMLYAEFTDVSKAEDWDFPDASLNFFELYNVTEDRFMLHNVYAMADAKLKDALHSKLKDMFHCKGQAECS